MNSVFLAINCENSFMKLKKNVLFIKHLIEATGL